MMAITDYDQSARVGSPPPSADPVDTAGTAEVQPDPPGAGGPAGDAAEPDTGFADMLFALGIAVLTMTMLRLLWKRRRSGRGADADREAERSDRDLPESTREVMRARDRIDAMIVESHDTVRTLSATIEQRAARLESLIERAERASERLERASGDADGNGSADGDDEADRSRGTR